MLTYGQVKWPRPDTVLIIAFICEMGMLGSAGAVASMVAIPVNPLHRAMPLASMLGPVDMAMDMGIGVGDMKGGLPTLQSTGVDVSVIGAMLKVPVAMNCTLAPGKF